jgi:DNA polymerase-3 subunit epsilon
MDTYTRWEDVPDHLKTKTGLKQMGLKPSRGQQPIAIKTHWHYKIPDYDLYAVAAAIPRVVTEAQREAAQKARQKSLEARTCTRCGFVQKLSRDYRGKWYVRGGLCPSCREQERRSEDRDAAIEWAKTLLGRSDVLLMDTETTDLDGEIIELALIDLRGKVVYSSRFNPISPMSEGAQAVHGLTADRLADEPSFADAYSAIRDHLTAAGLVVIYNAAFDLSVLQHTCELHSKEVPAFKTDCLMEWYAQYVNEWSNYYQSYRWQPLGGDHSALEDCRAALAILKEMATTEAIELPESDVE